jgi:hypothetical protein
MIDNQAKKEARKAKQARQTATAQDQNSASAVH